MSTVWVSEWRYEMNFVKKKFLRFLTFFRKFFCQISEKSVFQSFFDNFSEEKK